MTTRAFSTLSARVSASAPGCPYPLVVQHIRDAAIQVCERTLAWRYEQSSFNLTPGQYQYSFNKPSDTQVQAVMLVTMNGSPLEVLTLDDARNLYPEWPITSTTPTAIQENGSQPRSLAQVNTYQYVVLPAPDAEDTYAVRMIYALKPSRDALEMDADVFDQYEEPIFHRALMTLVVMPKVDWADRELAVYHAKRYMFTMTEARAQANLGVFRGSMSVRFPPFA
jgi:hypothetical protein